jgi:hypothetical protein
MSMNRRRSKKPLTSTLKATVADLKVGPGCRQGPTQSRGRTHQVKVGVTAGQGLKARTGDDQQQGAIGEASSPSGRQPTAQQQVAGC